MPTQSTSTFRPSRSSTVCTFVISATTASSGLVVLTGFPGSPKVARTRQAEETGSRSCQLHQTGEEFLNFEDALEETGIPKTGQAGGLDEVHRRAQKGSSRKPFAGPLTNTILYLSVGAGGTDGLLRFRSGLKLTHSSS